MEFSILKKLGLDVRSILVIAFTLLFPFSVIASPSSSEKLDSLKTWDTLVPIKAKNTKFQISQNRNYCARMNFSRQAQRKAGKQKDYKKYLDISNCMARQKKAHGFHGLGFCYRTGRCGIRKDLNAAVKNYEIAAKNGVFASQYWLTVITLSNKEIKPNYAYYSSLIKHRSLPEKYKNHLRNLKNKSLTKITNRRDNLNKTNSHKKLTSRRKNLNKSSCHLAKTKQDLLKCEVKLARKKVIASNLVPISIKKTCSHQEVWRETMYDRSGYFFSPKLAKSYFMIGGVGTNDNNKAYCNTIVKKNPGALGNIRGYLSPPKKWKRVWSNQDFDSEQDASIWRGVPTNSSFVCIGDMPQKGFKPPNAPQYRCIHKKFLKKVTTSQILWSDEGSGSEEDEKAVTVFTLKRSGLFVSRPGRHESHDWYDLKENLSSKPDPKIVERLLRKKVDRIRQTVDVTWGKIQEENKRIALIKAKEAKMRARLEEKSRAAAEAKRKAARLEAAKRKKAEAAKRRKAEAKRKAIKIKREQEFRNAQSFIKKYQNREKTLLEQVLNYAEFGKENGNLAKSAMWVQSGKCSITRHKFFWKYRSKGKTENTRTWDFFTHWTERAGRFQLNNKFYGLDGWKKVLTINLKKAHQTAFRIKTKMEKNIFGQYKNVTISTDFKTFKIRGPEGIMFDRLQKAWGLAFRKCPGKKSAF